MSYQIVSESLNMLGTFVVPENWDKYESGPITAQSKDSRSKFEWIMYVGGNDWEPNFKYQAVFAQKEYEKIGGQTRVWIKVKYPDEIKEDEHDSSEKQKLQGDFGKAVADKWLSIAKKLYSQHKKDYAEYSKILDSENKKLDDARSKGLDYDRKLPKNYPLHSGNWLDAFVLALKEPSLNQCIDSSGIESTSWIVDKFKIEEYKKEGGL